MKKQIIVVGLLIILVSLLSGCIDGNVMEGNLKTKEGKLIEMINTTFIFKDDSYLDLYSLGNYNISELKIYIGHNVKIKYTDRFCSELVSISFN